MGANTLQNEKKISYFKSRENTRLHLGSALWNILISLIRNSSWNRPAVRTALVKGYNGCLPWEQQQWGVRVPHAVYFFPCQVDSSIIMNLFHKTGRKNYANVIWDDTYHVPDMAALFCTQT